MAENQIIIILAIASLVIIASLWFVRKFFFRLFKFFVAALLILLISAGLYVYRMTPQRDPAIGKHAYLKDNGTYLGVVEASAEDRSRGEVWLVRPPGGYPLMYRKTRVVLKDSMRE